MFLILFLLSYLSWPLKTSSAPLKYSKQTVFYHFLSVSISNIFMMELGLSLGDDHTQKSFKFLDKSQNMVPKDSTTLGFCMGLGPFFASKGRAPQGSNNTIGVGGERIFMSDKGDDDERSRGGSSDPVLVQLDLLPFSPAKPMSQLRFPWLHSNANRKPRHLPSTYKF